MEPKKNPKADLSKRSTTFILIGLVLALLFTWRTLEYKQSEIQVTDLGNAHYDLDEDEELVITERPENQPPPPPPPPPAAPEVIVKVEDDVDLKEELNIKTDETDQEEEVEVKDEIIEEVEEVEDNKEYNFKVVEDKPIYPGCESVPKSQREACFQKKIQKGIYKKLKYPEISKEMGKQGRVFVKFVISKTGAITNIKAIRGPDKHLKGAAVKAIRALPRMTPAKQRGKPVKVSYMIPVVFKLQ